MRPVVVIGANGQLGSDLCHLEELTKHDVVPLKRSDVDLRDHLGVDALLESIRPAVIVNTAAFHKLEACEADMEQAFAVNCFAVRNLAQVAERLDARLVQLSTDYVFDGSSQTPYSEDAAPNPINTYGTSKIGGEFFVRSLCSQHLIVRTSGLYGVAGSSGKGGNFVQTMLKLGRDQGVVSVVTDQVLSPTFTRDLAEMIWSLIEADAQGVFHVTNSGSCSWYEFARSIFDQSGVQAEVRPTTTSTLEGGPRRPAYSVLANTRLEKLGFGVLRPWRDALRDYLKTAAQDSQETLGVKGATN
jgi:dTDP-4-dehydrorhamnose reductase